MASHLTGRHCTSQKRSEASATGEPRHTSTYAKPPTAPRGFYLAVPKETPLATPKPHDSWRFERDQPTIETDSQPTLRRSASISAGPQERSIVAADPARAEDLAFLQSETCETEVDILLRRVDAYNRFSARCSFSRHMAIYHSLNPTSAQGKKSAALTLEPSNLLSCQLPSLLTSQAIFAMGRLGRCRTPMR